jgi:hypothetical protein
MEAASGPLRALLVRNNMRASSLPQSGMAEVDVPTYSCEFASIRG